MFQNPRLSCDAEFRIACLDFGIHMFRFACRALVANNTNSEVISNPCVKRIEGWNHMLDLSRAERQRHTHASRSSHSTGTWRTRQLQACGERVEAVFLCTEAEMHKEWRCLLYQHWQSVIRLTFILADKKLTFRYLWSAVLTVSHAATYTLYIFSITTIVRMNCGNPDCIILSNWWLCIC